MGWLLKYFTKLTPSQRVNLWLAATALLSMRLARKYATAARSVCLSVCLSGAFSALDLAAVNAAGTGAVFACWLINCKLQGCLPGKPH